MQSRQGDITKIVAGPAGAARRGRRVQLVAQRPREPARMQALAAALAVYEMPVVPIPPPAPGSPPPVPQPGTFQTEQEKLDASLPKFLDAANAHPNADGWHRGAVPCGGDSRGAGQTRPRPSSATRKWWTRREPRIYARTARLGMAESQIAQGKFDNAITVYSELSRDTTSTLPLDSVLMHLGRAYARAGKKEEATARSRAWSTSSRSRRTPRMRVARWKKPRSRRRRRAPTRRAFRARRPPVGCRFGSTRSRSAYSVGVPVRWL